MSEKNLIICDSSLSYATFLMENILEKEELFVNVRACTSWENAEALLAESPVDILLVDEKWNEAANKVAGVGRVVVLTERKSTGEEYTASEICRYQSADAIVASLFAGQHIFHTMRDTKQKLIAVYSPIHRVGKTTFAIALGKTLARKARTLYLNMEEYPGLHLGYLDKSKENLSDLLYYIKQDCTDIGLRLSAMVQQEGKLEYLLPIPLCSDLKEVTVAEWKQLLEKLQETGYENIILDLGESVQGLYELLQESDKLYMPVLNDEISDAKLSCYKENLQKQGLEKLLYKTRKLEVEGETLDETVRRIAREDFGGVGFVEGDCR